MAAFLGDQVVSVDASRPLKTRCRAGFSDAERLAAYAEAVGETLHDAEARYAAAAKVVFGDAKHAEAVVSGAGGDGGEVKEEPELRVPTLGLSPADESAVGLGLHEDAEIAAAAREVRRVLAAQHSLRFAPQIAVLVSRFMEPLPRGMGFGAAETYVLCGQLAKRVLRTRLALRAWNYAFFELMRERVPKAHKKFTSIGHVEELFPLFVPAFGHMFAGWLSAAHVKRVVDVFVVEGPKVLLRIALAYVRCSLPLMVECTDVAMLRSVLSSTAAGALDYDVTSVAAFKLRNFGRRRVLELVDAYGKVSHPHIKDTEPVWFHPRFVGERAPTLLSGLDLDSLYPSFPAESQQCNVSVVYSSDEHGYGIEAFRRVAADVKPAPLLLAVRARTDFGTKVIGAYCSHSLTTKSRGWIGTGHCFVWTLGPTETYRFDLDGYHMRRVSTIGSESAGSECDPPPGADDESSLAAPLSSTIDSLTGGDPGTERMLMISTDDFFSFGGNKIDSTTALTLDSDFSSGSTAASSTYGNPPLIVSSETVKAEGPAGVAFEVVGVEVYGFVDAVGRVLVEA